MNITYTSIYKTSLPVLVSLLMEYLIGFTDTAYLGRVGETELAASAIAGTYYMIIYMIGFGFSIGAQILIAQCNGNRQYKEVGKILSQGILFLLIIFFNLYGNGATICLLIWLNGQTVMPFMKRMYG